MLRALRHRDFRLLWTGRSISLLGDGIYLVAIAWLVYDISNEPGALALVGLAWTLPRSRGCCSRACSATASNAAGCW